ncbi:MAG: DUF1573 domain-containing protein [Pirellulaceae bacterium]
MISLVKCPARTVLAVAVAALASTAADSAIAQVYGQAGVQYSQGRSAPINSNWMSTAIQQEDRRHDFGTVARAAKTEHRFYITNTSGRDMHLQSIRASCGCTTPIIETQDMIKPGEQGIILARFNTGTFTGQKQATLTVSIDQPYRTEIQLIVRGYIRSDVVMNPGEIAFGQTPEGEPKVVEVKVDYAGRSDWKIEDVVSESKLVEAEVTELSRQSGRVAYTIKATLSPNTPIGFLREQLILKTNDNRLTSVPVELTADVRPAIELSPKSYALGTIEKDSSHKQRLVVKGKKPFKILEITSPYASIVFDPSEDAKPAHLLNFELKPNAVGSIQGDILVRTDISDKPMRLKLSYFVDGPTVPTSTGASSTTED